MKKICTILLLVFYSFNASAQSGNFGIGVSNPTNKFHVVATVNPVRLEGLQLSTSTTAGTLVSDNTGVLKLRTANSISAVRATGSMTLATNNTMYFNDVSSAPTETFDNLNEFSGHTFTPSQPGLYQVTFTINYNQRDNTNDGADGYLGYAFILAGTPIGVPSTAPNYSSAANKVELPEATGTPNRNTVSITDLVKLAAGEVIQFKGTTYGSTNGVTATYTINIVRVD